MVAFFVLISGTALAIIGYADARHRASTLDLADQLVGQAGEAVIQRTVHFVGPAQHATAILAQLLASDPADLMDRPEGVALMASLVAVQPQLESAFASDDQGRIVQVRRGLPEAGLDSDALVLRRVEQRDGAADERFYRLEPGPPPTLGAPLSERRWSYDPRDRPWYRAALAAQGPSWTAPYVFSTTRTPGVTAVQAVRTPEGAVRAVAGADIPVGALSTFLREQRVGRAGLTFLVAGDRVVAHPDPALFAGSEDLPAIAELDVPGLPQALAGFRTGGPATARLESGTGELLVRFTDLPEPHGVGWTLVIMASTADFLDRVEETRRTAILISLLILGLAVGLAGLVARDISRPTEALADLVARIRKLRFDNDFSVVSSIHEVHVMSEALASMQAALQSFARFAPASLVQKLMASGEVARLGGEEREVTVLFSDIRGYATLTEKLAPQDVVELLNAYFSAMQEVIEAHQGEVLEYMGDAVLVVFGAPIDLPDHPAHAVRCARAMASALTRLNAEWERGGPFARWRASDVGALRSGVGIHTGTVVAGNLGSRTHMKYGVVGDTVNVAARLEALNKELDSAILISEATRARLPAELSALARPEGEFRLKGRGQPVLVYSLR